ncbi:MAG: DUF5018 domain-containing protein [Treponema sp.]|jgi:hypothetical protein|nr:DUF5018 domain-containing protein [Treponema sp.]
MKKAFFVFLAVSVSLFISCPNPVLKWIDTPAERESPTNAGTEDNGDTGRVAGQRNDKEIVSFTFGLGPDAENDLPIGRSPDNTGKFPINVILSYLPDGTSITSLKPTVAFTGKSLSPGSGISGDFSSPVIYTVTAEDGTSRDYRVKVYVKTDTSKEIVRFDLELGSGLAAEGIISENADGSGGTITATVPAGTNLNSITIHLAHTGLAMVDPGNSSHAPVTFDYTGDFSTPTTWAVVDREGHSKTYTLTVKREKSDVREITSFRLGITGEENIIGGEAQPDGKYPILVVVPSGSTLNNLTPYIDYSGVSISPAEDGPQSFSNPLIPVTYTVAAENGSTRDYVVKVITKEVPAADMAEITGFYIKEPLVQGVIDQTATPKTIVLTVPEGTPGTLMPDIYIKGVSVTPKSGQPFTWSVGTPVPYTVWAADGSSKIYEVSVFTVPAPPTIDTGTETADVGVVSPDESGNYTIIVEFPIHIENPVININYPGSGDTENITDIQNIYNQKTTTNNDTVIIVNPPADPPAPPQAPLSSDASIDAFYFSDPAAIGNIGNTGDGSSSNPYSIDVTVPYGTNLQNLQAAIVFTGKGIDGLPGHSPLKDRVRSFQGPVDYTVIAENDTESAPNRKYYRVTVTPGAPDTSAEITAFSFVNVAPTKVLISGIPIGGYYPIEITVPQGTDLFYPRIPVITYTGASIAGPSLNDSSGPGTVTAGVTDFRESETTPVEYTVTAQDGSVKTYAVTVREEVEETVEITGFYFTEPLAVGKINQNANLITVTVPSGTNRGSLKPSVYFTGMALNPPSGTANNFTSPATYTITGVTGKTRTYSVVVTPTPSSSKDITRFKLSGVVNTSLIIGAAPDADGTYPISIEVPGGTNLGSLGTEITHTGVSVSPGAETPRNFSGPQDYMVTAEDGTVKIYKVTVHAVDNAAKIITSFIFEEVPLAGGGSIRAVASIDQSSKNIKAVVPNTAEINSLTPTITYIGKSITGPWGGPYTANPFTESTGRSFTGSVTYTVNDQSGGTEYYTVIVTRQSAFTVTFEGDGEQEVIATNTFDPGTGIITVTVKTGNVDGPYDWYIDGVKQGVSGDKLELNTGNGSFYPGRYEIMVSGKKNGLHYTGKVYFVVSGGA